MLLLRSWVTLDPTRFFIPAALCYTLLCSRFVSTSIASLHLPIYFCSVCNKPGRTYTHMADIISSLCSRFNRYHRELSKLQSPRAFIRFISTSSWQSAASFASLLIFIWAFRTVYQLLMFLFQCLHAIQTITHKKFNQFFFTKQLTDYPVLRFHVSCFLRLMSIECESCLDFANCSQL